MDQYVSPPLQLIQTRFFAETGQELLLEDPQTVDYINRVWHFVTDNDYLVGQAVSQLIGNQPPETVESRLKKNLNKID